MAWMTLVTDMMFHGPIYRGLYRLDAWIDLRWP